jgi:hypothetical protein
MSQSKHALIGAGRWARWLYIASRVPDTFEAARSGLRTCFGDVRGAARWLPVSRQHLRQMRMRCDMRRLSPVVTQICLLGHVSGPSPRTSRREPRTVHRAPPRRALAESPARARSARAHAISRRRRPPASCISSRADHVFEAPAHGALCRFLSCRHAACPPCLRTSCRHASAGAAGTRDAPASRHDDQSRARRCGPRRGAATARLGAR